MVLCRVFECSECSRLNNKRHDPEQLENMLLEHFDNHFDSKPDLKILVPYLLYMFAIYDI